MGHGHLITWTQIFVCPSRGINNAFLKNSFILQIGTGFTIYFVIVNLSILNIREEYLVIPSNLSIPFLQLVMLILLHLTMILIMMISFVYKPVVFHCICMFRFLGEIHIFGDLKVRIVLDLQILDCLVIWAQLWGRFCCY